MGMDDSGKALPDLTSELGPDCSKLPAVTECGASTYEYLSLAVSAPAAQVQACSLVGNEGLYQEQSMQLQQLHDTQDAPLHQHGSECEDMAL